MERKKSVPEQLWLILSKENRVLGPFSSEEILEKIKKKEIVSEDRGALPKQRWSPLLEEARFWKAFQQATEEDTATKKIPQFTRGERTQTCTVNESLYDTISSEKDKMDEGNKGNEGDDEDEKNPRDERDNTRLTPILVGESARNLKRAQKAGPESNYIFEKDVRLKKNLQKRYYKFYLFFFAFLFLSFFSFYFYQQRGESRNLPQLLKWSREKQNHGFYNRAFYYMDRAHNLFPENRIVQQEWAMLAIITHQYANRGQIVLQNILQRDGHRFSLKKKTAFKNVIALAYLRENSLQKAEPFLKQAENLMQEDLSTLKNLFILHFLQGKAEEAQSYGKKILERERGGGFPLILMGMGMLSLEENPDREFLGKAFTDYLSLYRDSWQQVFLAYEIFREKGGRKTQTQTAYEPENKKIPLESFFSVDAYLTEDHLHDPLVHSFFLDWEYWIPHCQKIYQKAKAWNPIESKAFFTYCLIKANQNSRALQYLKELNVQSPNHPLILNLNLFWHSHHDEWAEAEAYLNALLKMKNQQGELKFHQWTLLQQQRLCWQKKDFYCVKEANTSLLAQNPSNFEGLYWSALLSYEESHFFDVRSRLHQVLQRNPNYRPALELKAKLE